MGSRVLSLFDLEIIEQAYEAVWAEIASREPFRDKAQDNKPSP